MKKTNKKSKTSKSQKLKKEFKPMLANSYGKPVVKRPLSFLRRSLEENYDCLSQL